MYLRSFSGKALICSGIGWKLCSRANSAFARSKSAVGFFAQRNCFRKGGNETSFCRWYFFLVLQNCLSLGVARLHPKLWQRMTYGADPEARLSYPETITRFQWNWQRFFIECSNSVTPILRGICHEWNGSQ
jgi:hypothetical protein